MYPRFCIVPCFVLSPCYIQIISNYLIFKTLFNTKGVFTKHFICLKPIYKYATFYACLCTLHVSLLYGKDLPKLTMTISSSNLLHLPCPLISIFAVLFVNDALWTWFQIVVQEIDGTPSRDFFTVLNLTSSYKKEHINNIYSFSMLQSWLIILQKYNAEVWNTVVRKISKYVFNSFICCLLFFLF